MKGNPMKEWLVKQNTAAVASLLVCAVTWLTGLLAGEPVLRFLALLFLAHAVVILFDREDGRRTAQDVAFSSLLVYDSLVDILEYRGVATRKEVENRMEEVRKRYRRAAEEGVAGEAAPDRSGEPVSGS
jgi:type III secretory pathway component EscV